MVSILPDEALSELLEDLRDLETQFIGSVQRVIDPAKPTTILNAKLGTAVARPQFYVDEE